MPRLIESGYEVVALVRSPGKARTVEAMGARVALADALHQDELTAAIVKVQPDVIIHQLTALAGVGSFRKFDEQFALTNRFRTEVTDTLLAAARRARTRRFIAQSFCGWPFAREGGPVKTEEDPLDPTPPAAFAKTLAALRYLEDTVRRTTDLEALALRYGILYGPGRRSPAMERWSSWSAGAGCRSSATARASGRSSTSTTRRGRRSPRSRGAPGIYNVVDDEPAPVSAWPPALADALGARLPCRVPVWLGRLAIGEGGGSMMTRVRGGSNTRAKRELGWEPVQASWRRRFIEGLGSAGTRPGPSGA